MEIFEPEVITSVSLLNMSFGIAGYWSVISLDFKKLLGG